MKRIAIIGGGISGLAAAYELELARKRGADIDWQLYEASERLGGILQTRTRDGFVMEGGPDGWVSEKPWARDLAIELGLEDELIYSNDATRKTYILIDGKLQPLPERMRMIVPEDLATLEGSPLFSDEARKAYADELANAAHLRETSPFADEHYDESVAAFVLRHFGEEVLQKLAAPLLSGVFGGDVARLSVRAVMPAFVKMEREHGSLIAALQSKSKSAKPQPIFTSLRNGMGSLIDKLIAALPAERLHLQRPALSIKREGKRWLLRTTAFDTEGRTSKKHFNEILLATSLDAASNLLRALDAQASAFLPASASSAVLTTFCWPAEVAHTFEVPTGFGFLVQNKNCHPERSVKRAVEGPAFFSQQHEPQLLAATFVDQKFPHRAAQGARIIRTFFGGATADALAQQSDETITAAALAQLREILCPLPEPDAQLTQVSRWPRSLPQYEVGHVARIAELDTLIAQTPGLTLLGNSYRGVGLPDLIRDARDATRSLADSLTR